MQINMSPQFRPAGSGGGTNWSGGLQGAGGGALTGFAVGGPVGAVIGGGLGLLGGLFGGNGEDEELKKHRAQLAALGGQGLGGWSPAQDSNLRGRQVGHLDQLQALSLGQGPSLATQLAQDQFQKAAASQQALAGSAIGRGVGAGGAYRNAANMTGGMQMQALRDTGMMRAQEQLGALSMLGGAIGNARGQDQQHSQFNAQLAADMAAKQRALQLQALMGAGGINPKTGPSMGEQILAGGAAAYGMMGGRGQQGMSPIAPGNPGAGGYFTPAWALARPGGQGGGGNGMGQAPMPNPYGYGYGNSGNPEMGSGWYQPPTQQGYGPGKVPS